MKRQLKEFVKNRPFLYACAERTHGWYSRLGAKKRWRKLETQSEIKLELGSGKKTGANGWITVDMIGADINCDLRKGIPLKDNSVSMIYTSHLFEHIPFRELLKFIGECRRVLKTGGQLSVCVPNARFFIEFYMKNENCYGPMFEPAVTDTGSFMDQVNYVAYMDGQHHYMFDQSNLVNTLKKGGFDNVVLRDFDPELDIESRDYCSIYAIATK